MLNNKKGQEEIIWAIFWFGLIFLGIILILGFIFSSVTVTQLEIEVQEGKISSGMLKETEVTWWDSYFGDETRKGYYSINITSNSTQLEYAKGTGAGIQTYNFKKFVECVKIELISDKKILDTKENICK